MGCLNCPRYESFPSVRPSVSCGLLTQQHRDVENPKLMGIFPIGRSLPIFSSKNQRSKVKVTGRQKTSRKWRRFPVLDARLGGSSVPVLPDSLSAHCTLGAVQWACITLCNWMDGRIRVGTRRTVIIYLSLLFSSVYVHRVSKSVAVYNAMCCYVTCV